MREILIIYPHWPPSNLAGVHRPRLIANFLPEFGWHPVVLTVEEQFYEEPLDEDLTLTVSPEIEAHKVSAYRVLQFGQRRWIGDIGLRAFPQLYRRAKALIRERKFLFVWIPIPSFYTALLGRCLHESTGIPYGIDYIDPWVSKLAPYDGRFSRAWWSNKLAGILEPIAVKKAALISGVSQAYYQGVLDRNFQARAISHVAMPYGFDPRDHAIRLNNLTLPWSDRRGVRPIVYAGAFLPQSHVFVRLLFRAMRQLVVSGEWPLGNHLYFLGTGVYRGEQISDYARAEGVEIFVTEIHARFPYLHILNFLERAAGVMVIGSTERHYTASKTFQALLAGRPVLAVLHAESSAAHILQEANAAQYLVLYQGKMTEQALLDGIKARLSDFSKQDCDWRPVLRLLDRYSAKASASILAEAIEQAVSPSA